MNIFFSSCGNDSIATAQWAVEKGLKNIVIAYSDTQWASREWQARVDASKTV